MNFLSIKWNAFESNASKWFSSLRQEHDFYDVTLVSDDEKELQAHKLVLSACSPFFKNILKGKSHPNPMLYLSGVSSEDLNLLLDYIYNGEVQVENFKLERFMFVAKIFKLEGLLETEQDNLDNPVEFDEKIYFVPGLSSSSIPLQKDKKPSHIRNKFKRKEDSTSDYFADFDSSEEARHKNEFPSDTNIMYPNINDSVKEGIESDVDEVEKRIAALREKLDTGLYRCKTCGKTMNTKRDLGRHIETHLEGLSFGCSMCEKTFRSRNSLSTHISIRHKVKFCNVGQDLI